jgi:SAM-dependent methyltransferase
MPLIDIFKNLDRNSDKILHYFDLYEFWFGRFVGKSPRILEVGIQNGGDAEMWYKFFGEGTQITGIDIDHRCKLLENDYLKIEIADQANMSFWDNFKEKDFDIIIDDASHLNKDQIYTLNRTFSLLKDNGIYWIEDTHTSYYNTDNDISFVDYSKSIIDVINEVHTQFKINRTKNNFQLDENLTKIFSSAKGIHYYDSIVLIEKGPRIPFERLIKKGKKIKNEKLGLF